MRSFVCLTAFVASGLLAAPAISANPVFNGSGKAWQVLYDQTNGNRRNDIAVQLKIEAVGGSDTKFTGKLLRYDQIQAAGMGKLKYKKRSDQGEIAINGVAEAPDASKKKKPLHFTASGTYVGSNQRVNVVVIYGTFHAGKNTDAASRDDDRLAVRIRVKQFNPPASGQGDGQGNGGGQGGLSGWQIISDEVFVTTLLQEPCDEIPDEDILTEETYTEEPEYTP